MANARVPNQQRKTLLLVDLANVYGQVAKRYEDPPEVEELLQYIILEARKRGSLEGILVFVSSNLPPGIVMENLRKARRHTPLLVMGPERGEETETQEPLFTIPGVALKTGESESDPTDKALSTFGSLLLRAGEVKHYIIVSGDGDFTDLINEIRNQQKSVEVFTLDLASTHPNLRPRARPLALPSGLTSTTLNQAKAMFLGLVRNLPFPTLIAGNQEEQMKLLLDFLDNIEIAANSRGYAFQKLQNRLWSYLKRDWEAKGLTLEGCGKILDVFINFTDILSPIEQHNARGRRTSKSYRRNPKSLFVALVRNPEQKVKP